MVVINDTAVRADGNIYAGSFIVFVSCLADLNQSRCLASADALGFSCDADRAAADTDFYKVCAAFGKEQKAFLVNNISGTDLDGVAVVCADIVDRQLLPFGKAFRRVDAKHVCTGIDKSRNSFGVVTGVDTGTDNVTLMRIQKLVRVLLMGFIVLAENEVEKSAVFADNGERVELVIPDNVVRFGKGRTLFGGDKLFKRRHKGADLFGLIHTADTVVTACYNADKLAVRGAVVRYGNGGVTRLFLKSQYIGERCVGGDVRIARNEAGFIRLCSCDHGCFVFYGLGAVDKGNTAAFGKSDCESVARNRLHDSRNHRNVQLDGGLFPFFVLDKRRFERNVRRNALA